MKKKLLSAAIPLLFCTIIFAQSDPLPSWKDDALKASIISFVTDVTTTGSPKFVPVDDRIATFDNDGTLWCEKPLIEGLFAFFRAKQMIAKKPTLAQQQPYKAIAAGDMAYLKGMSENDLIKLVVATHSNMTQEEFEKTVQEFYKTAKSPQGKTMDQLVYQPQLELLYYLRDHGFKTFICTGGDADFVRAISKEYYGIPREQVIGTTSKLAYKDSAGVNDLYRLPGLQSFNDKQAKPVNIQYVIGKRPIFACGNEGGAGDVYMLRFSQGSKYESFQMIVNHDDKEREFYYQEKDNKSLNWAKKYNWHVVSMKDNWNNIFPTN